MADPRNNSEDAYLAFMSMDQREWLGLIASLASGGVLTPAEQVGFDRALEDRKLNRQKECPSVFISQTSRSGFFQALFAQCQERGEHEEHRAFWTDGARHSAKWRDGDKGVLTINQVPEGSKLV